MLLGTSTFRPTLRLLAILCTLIALNFLYKTEAATLAKASAQIYDNQQVNLVGNYSQPIDSLPNLVQKEHIKEKLLQLEQLQRSMELADEAEKETYANHIKAQRDEFIKAVKLAKGLDTTITTQASARMMPTTPCPEMQVIELLGIPGFAETNELVICGAPDTLAFLMFIEEPGNISGTQMTATFLPGMQYAGFELTRYGTTTISNLDPTPSNPKFLLEGITDGVYIGYIGVEATCDADINAFDYSVGLDFNFIYEDTLGNFQRCRQSITPIRAYNSVIKEPVLNFRRTANTTVTSLATETCTTVQISQDGIDAYLTEIDFSICNVDFANELSLTSISANGTPVPYNYNAADSTVTMTIGGSFFQNNSRPNPADTLFGESEFLNIVICMQIDECPSINTQIVTYKASYDCNGDICQTIQQQREISVQPTDRPVPIATSELVQQPGVCGTPAVMELNLTSSIADSAAGIFTDLTFGYETCQSSSLDISKVTIGGMTLPATAYSWNNGDILIDLTTLATDPDGPGGIQDADMDGFYDDLPGGEAVVVQIELDFQCSLPPDPTSIDCASIDCSFGQFFIRAKRDCGQDFTFEPPVADFSIRNGATFVELKNQDQINTSTIGYDFGITRTSGANCSPLPVRVKTVEFCYIYETENVAPCDAANTTNELQVVFDGSPRLVYDVEFVAGSGEMTVNGVTTQTGATGTFTDLSASSRVLSLPIGELNEGDEVCYIYQLAADSASCSPAIYMNGVHQVIETCSDGGCTCKTVKACDVALFRSDPSNCSCTCDISSGATTRRWNLGYTDETMTQKVALEDVPVEDLNRYLPCDTMFYEGYMTFNSPESIGELYQWFFIANITSLGNNGWAGNDDTELMIDANGTELLGLEFSPNGGGGARQDIDVSSLSECLDQPGGGATGFFSYAGKTPWSDVTFNTPLCSSGFDYHDGNLFGVYFRNFNKLEDCRGAENNNWEEVNCLDQLKSTYGIGIGDTIYMKWLLPLTKNVKAFANKTADPSFTFQAPQIINVASGHFLDEFDSDCLVGLSNCRTNSPFSTFCPEDLNAVTEVKLDDCGGSVEHNFNVIKPTPVNWFTEEYRPFFTIEDIEVPMYSPLIYCGNAKLVTKGGVEYPLEVQSLTNHDCATVNGQEYCTVSNGTEGTLTFNPETDGYPGLGVGLGGLVDEFKIVYDLCKVCPAESPDLLDYEITYDYRICETLNGVCFRCNQATNGTSNELPMVCGTLVNRLDSYYDELNMDTLYRWDNVTSGDLIKTDTSKGFPALSQNQDQNLLASASPGTSEELNTFEVCADGSDMSLPTHKGVLSSVTLTNSVELVGAYDAAGIPLVFDTVSTSATSNTYAIFLPDLAPGDCMTFTIGTRLLYCPVPPDLPEICVTTTSGCMDRDIMAALAGITSNCNSIETCYEYIFEEAAIQADFLLPNEGDTYALCDTIPLAVLVKNVKGTTVKDLILDIDLPLTGMEIIPGSFEASYPNSGNFALPFYSIVDPAINGNNLLYTEDNDFSNAIHSNGLPGVTSAGDSNFVVVRFQVETICDEFVSGSQASFEATAKDPCSPSTISSGLVTSNSIIIDGGNPADFGQVLITAKPSEAFCGQETPTFTITGQNISEKPLGDSVIMCVTLPAGIDYQAGSMRYIIPTTLDVGVETVMIVNGQTQICFQGFENMPVGGAFTLNFEADFDVAAMCGDYDIQVDTKNLIEDQSCTDGGECDVFVQSSVNPNFTMTLKGPLETVDLKLFRQCDGNDDPVTICYEVVLRNPGPDYNGDVLVNLHDDLQANQILDFYDPILGTGSHTGISVASGDSITLTGCYTVDEINSCPVILDMVYDSPCACNHLATPYATIEPEFTAVLPPTTVLCPGQELGLNLCGNFDISYDPASNIVTRMVGDSLYLSVVDQSIVTRIDFTGTAGECSVDETRFIRGVEDFDLGIADSLTCQNQDFILEATIPIEYQDFITVNWSPATNLDDATILNPLFNSATPGLYKYEIKLEFNGGCILKDSVTVEVKPVGMINITGNNTICYPFETNTLAATAGYDYYEWYLLDGGFEIIQAATVPEMWTGATEPGKYIVKGFRSTDMCPSASDTIMITQADCVDLELEKTICEIDPVPNFGDTISYQIEVCNRQNTDSILTHNAEMVQVTDVLPAGVMFVSYTATQGTYTPGGLWDIGTITSGACQTLKIKAQLVDYGKQINTAQISNSSKEDIDSEENNDDGDQSEDDEDMAMFTLEPFDLALKKIICAEQMVPVVNLNDSIEYCIIVENQGSVDAYNISVADHPAPEIMPIDPNWTDSMTFWAYNQIDSLLVGETDTIRFLTQITAIPSDSFALNFSEILSAEDKDGDNPTDIDSTPDSDDMNDGPFEDNKTDGTNGDEDDHDPSIIHIKIVDLALKKTTTNILPVKIGQDIPYTITVFNQGNVPITNIKVSEYIPDGLALNAGLSPNWMDMDSIAMILIPNTLLVGDSINVPITMTVQPGATPANLINVAEISSFQDTLGFDVTLNDMDSDGDTNPNNDAVPAPGAPDDNNIYGDAESGEDEDDSDPEGLTIFDLALKKETAETGPFSFGDAITFDFTVYNQGNVPAKNIEITEVSPCGYMVAPSNSPLWFTTGTISTTTISNTIPPGDSFMVSIDLIVQQCTLPDAWKNTAEISASQDDEGNDTTDSDIDSDADGNPSNDGTMEDNATEGENGDEDDSDFEIIEIFDLALTKTILTPSPYQYGDVIEFEIAVYNQGNVPAANITVADSIPAGYTYSAGNNIGWTGSAPVVDFTFAGPILPLDSAKTTIKLTLENIGGGIDKYTNIAEIAMAQDTTGMTPTDSDSTPDANFGNDVGGEPEGPTNNQTDGNGTDDEDDHDPAIINIFDLALNKTTMDVGPFKYGDVVTFDFTVYNQGNIIANNIEITEVTPCGFTVAPSSSPLWSTVGNTSTTTITTALAPGDSTVVSIDLIVQPCGNPAGWKNTGEISASEDDMGNDTTDDDIDSDADEDPSNDGDMEDNATDNENGDEDDSDFEEIEIFDLAQIKEIVSAGPFEYGDTIHYLITVVNQGNVTADEIYVFDHIPPGLIFDATLNLDWTPSGSMANTIIEDPILPGLNAQVELYLILNQTIPGTAADFTNISEIESSEDADGNDTSGSDADSNPDLNATDDMGGEPDGATDNQIDGDGTDDEDDHDPAIISIFDLALKKTTTEMGPFSYGQTIKFDYTVYNQGNVPAMNIKVNDYIPCGYSFAPSNAPTWSLVADTAMTTIASTIQPGDSTIVSIEFIIEPCAAIDAWKNVGEIAASEDDEGNDTTADDIDSQADSDPSNDGDMEDNGTDNENGDEDDSDFEIIEIFDLALTKKVVNPLPFYIPGDTVEYKIAVYNQGNTSAYDLQIGDYLPTGLVFIPNVNTAAATGNPYDWINNGSQVTTEVDSLNIADSTCLTLKFLIGYSFRGSQIINYAEIGNAASDIGGPNETDADSDADTNNDDIGGQVGTDEDDHIDDDGTDINGDGITDEDDHDPAVIEVRAFSTRILNACNCLENGYAQDEVMIYSPIANDVWTITQNTGMLTNGLSSIPLNTNVAFVGIENGYYVYTVTVTHQSTVGYTGVFANGLTTLTVSNICDCPTIITTPDGIPPPTDSIPTITQTLSKTSIAENILGHCEGTSFSNYTVHSLYVDTAACRTAQTLCPQNQWQRLKITFSEFDLAAGDTLCVFEGKDTLGTPIAKWSGAGVSQTGGWISANCDPDLNPSGCLTFLFKTNGDNNKGLGWRSTATCEESDIVLNANNLQAKLTCEETHKVLTIQPATVTSGCTALKDSQFVRIFNAQEELCKDTCLAIDKSFDLPFAIGQYKVEYKLKSDTAKTTTATISVQETPIVCNDKVTIPMGSGCSIAISPDDLLENPCDTITDTIYYFITLKGIDKNGQEIVLASGGGKGGNYPVLTKDMIDQCNSTITANIERRYYEGLDLAICNNGPQQISCEVEVNIKDELAPVFGSLAPTDTLVACNVTLTQTGLGLITPDAVDNCGAATVTFGGAEITTPSTNVCDTTRAIISWIATDECGNTATATQQVVIVRPQLADIVKTGSVTLACDSEAAINESTIPSIKTGRLKNGVLQATDTIALSTTEYICGYLLQYTDTQIPAVDCGRKVFRNWIVLDWCNSENGPQPIDTTFIAFTDTKAPQFVAGAGANKVIDLDHQACTYDVHKLAQPAATDNCSTPSVRLATVARIEDGQTWELPVTEWAALDCDSFQLTWIAEDDCHEQLVNDTVTQIILIQDESKPSVNCTDNINLSLGQEAAILHYAAIDAGSYDACGIAKYEVSRNEVVWDSIVTFDCQDIHVDNKVYLRVTDNKGNQNTCWMIVNVEDKVMPICSDLPTVNTTCDEGHIGNGLLTTDTNENGQIEDTEWVDMTPAQATEFNNNYGQPNCSDNVACEELVIEQQYQFIKKACGVATIKRRYRAIDWQGEGNISNWAAQTINVESKADWTITLPADWKGQCGNEIPDADILINNGPCDLLGYEVEEKEFAFVEDACLKVVRTFTITNWCNYEVGDETVVISRPENEHGFVNQSTIISSEVYENIGRLTYIQILKSQDTNASAMATVSGNIMDWKEKTVENTLVTTTANTMTTEGYLTNEDGLYHFELPMNSTYSIEPQKNDNPLNGVSTFDLVLISKHILGITTFDNPYQYIAADANKSGTITAFDMVQIRQLILNIKTEFTNNESWRFVLAGQDFNDNNPLATDFAEMGQVDNLSHDMLVDFVAVKVGDVNGNARTNSLVVAEDRSTESSFNITTTDRYLIAGEQVSVTFATNQIKEVQGYQFTLVYDNLQLEKLHSGLAGIEHFGLHKMDEGWITTSWNNSVGSGQSAVSSGQPSTLKPSSTILFTIDFTAKQNGRLSEQLSIIDKPTAIEAYSAEPRLGDEIGHLMNVELTFTETNMEGRPFELFQNEPNPFKVNTSVGFYLPGDSEIVLTLRNEAGQILKVIKEDRTSGEHRINLENVDLPSGFIYYQLTSKYGAQAKKMLHLD